VKSLTSSITLSRRKESSPKRELSSLCTKSFLHWNIFKTMMPISDRSNLKISWWRKIMIWAQSNSSILILLTNSSFQASRISLDFLISSTVKWFTITLFKTILKLICGTWVWFSISWCLEIYLSQINNSLNSVQITSQL